MSETIYRQVPLTYWHLGLSPFALHALNYLTFGPRSTQIPGVVVVGRAAIVEDLGFAEDVGLAAIQELEDRELVVADWKARLVWVPRRIEEVPPANPNAVKSWRWAWLQIPPCALRDAIEMAFYLHLAKRTPEFLKAADGILDVAVLEHEHRCDVEERLERLEKAEPRNGPPNRSGNGSGDGSSNETGDWRLKNLPLPPHRASDGSANRSGDSLPLFGSRSTLGPERVEGEFRVPRARAARERVLRSRDTTSKLVRTRPRAPHSLHLPFARLP